MELGDDAELLVKALHELVASELIHQRRKVVDEGRHLLDQRRNDGDDERGEQRKRQQEHERDGLATLEPVLAQEVDQGVEPERQEHRYQDQHPDAAQRRDRLADQDGDERPGCEEKAQHERRPDEERVGLAIAYRC